MLPPRSSPGFCSQGPPVSSAASLASRPSGLQASRSPGWPAGEAKPAVTKANTSLFQGLSVFNPRPSMHLKYCSASRSSLYVSGQKRAVPASLAFCVPCFQKPPWKVTSPQKPLTASHHLLGASSIFKVSFICLKKIPAWVCTLIHPFRLMSPCWVPRGCTKAQTWG